MEETKEKRLWYFSYPADGTIKTFSQATIEVDVAQGEVQLPDKREKLSSSLDAVGVKDAKAIYIFVNKDCKMQFHKEGWLPIRANVPFFLNHALFNFFRVDFAEETKGNFIIFIDEATILRH